MNRKLLVAVDSGTQSVRVFIFDSQGNVISSAVHQHEPLFQVRPGWAEHHPEELWEKLCLALREAVHKLPNPHPPLAAVGLTGQRATTGLLDQNGNALRPFVSWTDPRRKSWAHWVHDHEPENYENTYKISSIQGWLVKRLTSEFKDCVSYPVIGPVDLECLTLSTNPDDYETFGMPREKVIDACAPGTLVGTITPAASAATGLPPGLPVAVGAGDKQVEVLGGGAIFPGRAYITSGTMSSLLVTTFDKPLVHPQRHYRSLGAAIPGAWNPEYVLRGHWMVSWFTEQFCKDEIEASKKMGMTPEELLNQEAASVPPGANGLVLFPYWDAQSHAPLASGLIIGFHDGVHKRGHVFRAILEGIAYGLRAGKDIFNRDLPVPIQEIVVGGGGSQSRMGMQAYADILGLPCRRTQTSETCSLGAAIEAAVGIGEYPDFFSAVEGMVHYRDIFEPISQNQKMYDEVYERVYSRLYPCLEDVFGSLKEIREQSFQEDSNG
jgi:sugar (pentulose or hexulose) kinase